MNDGPTAIALARDEDFELMILDLGLPVLDGTEVLRTLRAQGRTLPILILSARDDVRDKVAGLQLGADDYLDEAVRVRRAAGARAGAAAGGGDERADGADASAAWRSICGRGGRSSGETIELSAREFALLELFLRHPDQVLSREQLLARVWGYDFDPGSNVVEVYVGYLRRKLGAAHIETVRGMGYRLRAS